MEIKLQKQFTATLYIHCGFPVNDEASTVTSTVPLSPTEMIKREDIGRYYRNVKWERPFNAANWKGKLAYVNSIFGDGQKMPMHQFVICPTTHDSGCLTFEANDGTTRLKPTEIDALVGLLETITYIPEAERLDAASHK
jgi:hypothetical protein